MAWTNVNMSDLILLIQISIAKQETLTKDLPHVRAF